MLAGFDFPFGYPEGVAGRFTGAGGGLALWAWLAERIADAPDNANNRYEVAEAMNAAFEGPGPFWGRPAAWAVPGVPARRTGIAFEAERRIVERRVRSAKPCFQLAYAGSVGSQVLVGLPALERLRRHAALAGRTEVWPFETGLGPGAAPIVIAEIYPSLIPPDPGEAIKDAGQVRAVVRVFAAADAAGLLGPVLAGAPDLTPRERRVVETEEAWILGAGWEAALRAL